MTYALIDCVVFTIVLGLGSIVTFPGLMAFFNIKRGTNAVMKLKGVENKRQAMTFKETLVFIYGEDYTLTKILFAAYYDDDD